MLLLLHSFAGRGAARAAGRESLTAVTRLLGITDLAVWTEARYTRHPSQADFFSPFQESPAAPDYFPAGSIVAPPPHLPGRGAP